MVNRYIRICPSIDEVCAVNLFSSPGDLQTTLQNLPRPDDTALERGRARQAELTKPPGSLGRLEEMAVWLAGWQGQTHPELDQVQCLVFAGNHGVAEQGVSAFPASVTHQMVANFKAGGAAINQLCEVAGACLSVVPLDLDKPTQDFTESPAMSSSECLEALQVGAGAIDQDADLILLGEMGIANTTSAAALAMAAFGGDAMDWVGAGTGLDDNGVRHKAEIVERAIRHHADCPRTSFDLLKTFGGREIVAMAGALIAARQRSIPVLLDGYISTISGAVLTLTAPDILDHALISHMSAEPGHRRLLQTLEIDPILDLGMRLGEASGAAVCLMVLRLSLAAHNGMATFAEAGVSEKSE